MSVIGLRVGPFEIIEPAVVPEPGDWYRAERTGHTRKKPHRVLVRLLPPSADEAARGELQRTFERLRAVEDDRVPAAVALYEGIGALAIDAPDGVSFQDIVEARRAGTITMTPPTLLDLGIDVAECLQHAHHRNRVHGHLSAEHLRLSTAGRLFVFGFGAGPEHPPDARWVAPERVERQPATPATDQWALGAILAGLITGHEAWDADRTAATGDLSATVDAVERQWPALARLFRRMLEPDPANRFPTMHPVRQELFALARRAGSTSDRRELGRAMALRVSRPVRPETEVSPIPEDATAAPEPPPLPSPPPPSPEPTAPPPHPETPIVSTTERDPEDPPSIPDAHRTEPPPPSRATTPLADEPLDVVAPDVDAESVPDARRPLEPAPVLSRKDEDEDEEDVDDAPTVRFDPLMAKELAKLADATPAPAPAPAPLDSADDDDDDDDDLIDDEPDPQTLARALAVDPASDPFGGMPTAVPITDAEDLDEPVRPATPPILDRPVTSAPIERPMTPAPPAGRPDEASGLDVKKLAPLLVVAMVVLMGIVVLVSLR
jgi:hypothetical protein